MAEVRGFRPWWHTAALHHHPIGAHCSVLRLVLVEHVEKIGIPGPAIGLLLTEIAVRGEMDVDTGSISHRASIHQLSIVPFHPFAKDALRTL